MFARPRILQAFSLVELLSVMAILAVLTGMVVPVLQQARGKARAAQCLSNARQIACAFLLYASDYDEHAVPLGIEAPRWPNVIWWPEMLWPHVRNRSVFNCPDLSSFGIGMNHPWVGRWLVDEWWLPSLRLAEIDKTAETVVFADAGLITNPTEPNPDRWQENRAFGGPVFFRTPDNTPYYYSYPTRAVGRHQGKASTLFADGHATALPISRFGFQYPRGHVLALWDLE